MNNEFANENPKKDLGFILSLAALLLFTLMGVGIDYDEFLQKDEINIPNFYFLLIFFVDFLIYDTIHDFLFRTLNNEISL